MQFLRILRFRFRQGYRIIAEAGIGLVLLSLFVCSGIILTLGTKILLWPGYMGPIVLFIILLAIDLSRKDKTFLHSVFSNQKILGFYFAIEYMYIAFFVVAYQAYLSNWLYVILLLLCAVVIGMLSPYHNYSYERVTKQNIKMIPISFFEIKFYLEKYRWRISLVYFVGLFSFFHIAFFLIPLAVLIFQLPEVIRYAEPREMITPEISFMYSKIFGNVCLIWMILLPLFLLALFFQSTFWILILYSFVGVSIAMFTCYSYKYSRYLPFYNEIPASTILYMMILCIFLPGGAIISLLYGLFHFQRACLNMSH